MTALTHDRKTEYSGGELLAVPVAAGEVIFAGSLVCSDASGYAVPASDTAGLKFEGVATEQVDNSGGEGGEMSIIVRRRGRHRFACATPLDQSAFGAKVYAVDDQTVAADASDVTNDVQVGVIDRIESSSDCWVSIEPVVLAGKTWTAPTTTAGA